MFILIKGGRVVDPKTGLDDRRDVYISDDQIKRIEPEIDPASLPQETRVIDATGLVVAPGLVDMHCHLREPGYEHKEDIESGTSSAAMGGITSVACMPNTNPTIDSAPMVDFVTYKAKRVARANVYVVGAITQGLEGKQLAKIGEMREAGIVAVSDDGRPVSNSGMMRHAMDYAKMFQLPVISHCEEKSLSLGGVMNEGYVSAHLGLMGIPNAVEDVMIARDLILARLTGAKLHVAHVSTRDGVDMIREAKSRGVACVTCETCPHYFSLDETAVEGFNTNAKMNPPLRTADDVAAIIEGLKDGTIDAIATDHAPHHLDEKNLPFGEAMNGIVGFETMLGLGLAKLVKPGHLTLTELLKKMTVNPAQILSIDRGTIEPSGHADLTLFDPDAPYTVDTSRFVSRSKNSPFNGFELYGKPRYTIVNGKIVVDNGKLV